MAITKRTRGLVAFKYHYLYICDHCGDKGGVEKNSRQDVGDTAYCPQCLPLYGYKVTYHPTMA